MKKRILFRAIAILVIFMTFSCSKSESKGKGGKITYTANGKTYTVTNNVSTAFYSGEIGDISNRDHTVSIGNGTPHSFEVGKSYVCSGIIISLDGVSYSRLSKNNIATITFYDGNSVKGEFSGTVYNEETKETIPVSGTFETNDITKI